MLKASRQPSREWPPQDLRSSNGFWVSVQVVRPLRYFTVSFHQHLPADSERAGSLFHKVRTVSPKIVTAEMQATQQVLLSNIPVGALPVVIDLAASLRPVLGPSERVVVCTVDDKLEAWESFMARTAISTKALCPTCE